jgi:hypothetical protein
MSNAGKMIFGLVLVIFVSCITTTASPTEVQSLIPKANVTGTLPLIHHRVKRSHGSCTTGASLDGQMNAGDANSVNVAANQQAAGRGRGKRSAPSVLDPIRRLGKSILGKFTQNSRFGTRTQEIFDYLNRNVGAFQDLLHSRALKALPQITSRIQQDPNGVKCKDLCAPEGTLYALVGFCTSDYCKCTHEEGRFITSVRVSHSHSHSEDWDWESGGPENEWTEFKSHGQDHGHGQLEQSCHHTHVFDPVSLQCAHPGHTVLCSNRRKSRKHLISKGWSW